MKKLIPIRVWLLGLILAGQAFWFWTGRYRIEKLCLVFCELTDVSLGLFLRGTCWWWLSCVCCFCCPPVSSVLISGCIAWLILGIAMEVEWSGVAEVYLIFYFIKKNYFFIIFFNKFSGGEDERIIIWWMIFSYPSYFLFVYFIVSIHIWFQ